MAKTKHYYPSSPSYKEETKKRMQYKPSAKDLVTKGSAADVILETQRKQAEDIEAQTEGKDPFSEVENKHNSPNTHEFFKPREWSGRYVGLESDKSKP